MKSRAGDLKYRGFPNHPPFLPLPLPPPSPLLPPPPSPSLPPSLLPPLPFTPFPSQGERQRQRQEWRKGQRQGRKASNATCAEGLDTAQGCAPVKDGSATWSRTRTEEDDETLQLGYLGSESCLMSSPPGLRDAFSAAGWTVVTRKSRNRQQCSRRHGCCDKRGTVLGSLWDDDNDMILVQVADDRTRKGMVKISAVVDSGAEANALPEMQWIPLKPSSASKSGKIFRGAGGDSIPARGRKVGDWPNG